VIETQAPGIRVLRLPTPTLPPATHINTWILGARRLTVVDPGSPWPREQATLERELRALARSGEQVERIWLTHHHIDHTGGVEALAAALGVPVAAHPATASRVPFAVDELLEAGPVSWGGHTWQLTHTPGHAPGHLVARDDASGAMIAGDMVAGTGTILIEPGDGNLGDYLASLAHMRTLQPTVLHPAHGPDLHQADAVLAFYIAHRHQRSSQITSALDSHGASTPLEIARVVYAEFGPEVHAIGAVQVLAHLTWLAEHGEVTADGDRWRTR
jgi:glyoxylase-like metal-dependent hydrolase (beta-lactamase superfamily II)